MSHIQITKHQTASFRNIHIGKLIKHCNAIKYYTHVLKLKYVYLVPQYFNSHSEIVQQLITFFSYFIHVHIHCDCIHCSIVVCDKYYFKATKIKYLPQRLLAFYVQFIIYKFSQAHARDYFIWCVRVKCVCALVCVYVRVLVLCESQKNMKSKHYQRIKSVNKSNLIMTIYNYYQVVD